MSTISEFISQYTAESRKQLDFAWNGKHAAEFVDSNQEFRWQVVNRCLAQPATASPLLLEHLFLADAEWAAEAWGAPHHFAQLGSTLLLRGQEAALEAFAMGYTRSFDTFGACHEIEISKDLLARLAGRTKELLSQATEESQRNRLEAVVELFAQLENETASQGWAKVKPGTPISNVRVVWPRWYHKLWNKISGLWQQR